MIAHNHITGKGLVDRLWQYRVPALVICLLLVMLSGTQLVQLRVDNSLEIWFLDDDPALLHYQDFKQQFGNDEVLVIALRQDTGLLDPAGLQRLQVATRTIAKINGIDSVTSLATLLPAGQLAAMTTDGTGTLRKRLLADPALTGRWLSRDGTVTVIAARLAEAADIDRARERILADVRSGLDVYGPYHLAGIGVIYSALNKAATHDSALVTGTAYLLMLILLWSFYRRVRPLLLTLTIVGASVVLQLGLYAAAGRHINMVTMVLPTLVLVIGVSTSVHLLLNVARMPENLSPGERVRRGIGQMFWPCLVNTITTATGFTALVSSPMPVVQDLGLYAAVGVIGAFVLSIVLSVAFAGNPSNVPLTKGSEAIRRGVSRMSGMAVDRPVVIAGATLLVVVFAVFGMARLEVDTYTIRFLYSDHPVRQDSRIIEERVGPYMPLEFTVHSASGVTNPRVFKAIQNWQQRVEQAGLAGWSDSLPSRHVLVPSAGTTDSLSAHGQVLDDAQLKQLVHGNDTLRVSFGVPMQSARNISGTIDRVQALAVMPGDVVVTPTGYLPLYVRMIEHIVSTQLSSFSIAFLVIVALLMALFRSLRFTGLILLSNIVPVMVLLGAMGWLGIPLDAATVTITAIVFGLVVDDTVQFLYRFRQENLHFDTLDAVHNTVTSIGHSMALTTIVMVAGFAVLALAAIKSIVFFGLLVALAMVAALLADVLVLPAALSWMERYDTSAAQA